MKGTKAAAVARRPVVETTKSFYASLWSRHTSCKDLTFRNYVVQKNVIQVQPKFRLCYTPGTQLTSCDERLRRQVRKCAATSLQYDLRDLIDHEEGSVLADHCSLLDAALRLRDATAEHEEIHDPPERDNADPDVRRGRLDEPGRRPTGRVQERLHVHIPKQTNKKSYNIAQKPGNL